MPPCFSLKAKRVPADDADAFDRLLNTKSCNGGNNTNFISDASLSDGNEEMINSNDSFVDDDLLEDLYKIASPSRTGAESSTAPPPDALDVFSQLLDDSLQHGGSPQENINYFNALPASPNNFSSLINNTQAAAGVAKPDTQVPASVTAPGACFPPLNQWLAVLPQHGFTPMQLASLLTSIGMNGVMFQPNKQATAPLPANLVQPLDTGKGRSTDDSQRNITENDDFLTKLASSLTFPSNPGTTTTTSIKSAAPARNANKKPQKEETTTTSSNNSVQPLRALSAYNYFFLCQRERILNGGGACCAEDNDDDDDWSIQRQEKLLRLHWDRDRTVRRRHRKSHGKITFANLSKQISQAWKNLPEHRKDFFREVAAKDWARYHREITQYKIDSALAAEDTVKTDAAFKSVVG
jgi:hypothetical protein